MSGVSRIEQETIMVFNEQEKTATVETYSTRIKKVIFKALEESFEDVILLEDDKETGRVKCIVPKKWVKLRMGRKLTDEQRKAMSNRMKMFVSGYIEEEIEEDEGEVIPLF